MSEKTIIAILQDICNRNGFEPIYELVSIEGVVHAPTFIYRVQVGELEAKASAKSKKKAKHAVAAIAVEMLIKESDYEVENADIILEMIEQKRNVLNETVDSSDNLTDEAKDDDPNPVGKLQEICIRKRWRPPIYEVIAEEGVSNDKVFHMNCILENIGFDCVGIAKTKRFAKRRVAQLMINRLKDENLDKTDELIDKLRDKHLDIDSNFVTEWTKSKGSGKRISAKNRFKNFCNSLNEENKHKINEIIESSVDSSSMADMGLYYDKDYLSVLSELTKSIDCTFEVLTVPQLSYSQCYQCLIHVIPNGLDSPIMTAWGSADLLADAKQTAAGNAIRILKLLNYIPN